MEQNSSKKPRTRTNIYHRPSTGQAKESLHYPTSQNRSKLRKSDLEETARLLERAENNINNSPNGGTEEIE